MSVGFDINRFVRWLNPTQTFFITTQLFYKHVFDSPGDLVLPVPFRNITVGPSSPIVGNPNNPDNLSAPSAAAADRRAEPTGGARPGSVPAPQPAPLPAERRTSSCRRCSSPRRTRAAGSSRRSACSTTGWAVVSSSPASSSCATRSASSWTTRRSLGRDRGSSARSATRTTSGCRSSTCSDSSSAGRSSDAHAVDTAAVARVHAEADRAVQSVVGLPAWARAPRRVRMKFLVAALVVACAAVARAEPVELSEVRQNLFATCFPTDREGWMVGELGRIFRTDRRRRDLGAAGRRHEAAVPGDQLPRRRRRHGSPARKASSMPPATAATPGRGADRLNRHIFAIEFPNARARPRRSATSARWSTPRTAERPGPRPRARERHAARERARHGRRARRRQPLRHQLRRPRSRLDRRRVRHHHGVHRRRATWQQQTRRREHALRRPLPRREARLRGGHRLDDPATPDGGATWRTVARRSRHAPSTTSSSAGNNGWIVGDRAPC